MRDINEIRASKSAAASIVIGGIMLAFIHWPNFGDDIVYVGGGLVGIGMREIAFLIANNRSKHKRLNHG
jgi:hypothetical protein